MLRPYLGGTMTLEELNGGTMPGTPQTIIREAEALLHTSKLGLADLRGDDPSRRRAGFRNAVVFGRMVTLALQNLRGKHVGFEEWYAPKRKALGDDATFKRIYEMRTEIEKQATTPMLTAMTLNFDSSHLARALGTPPPGATGSFAGDDAGGSGWLIQTADGTTEKFYVALPPGMIELDHKMLNADGTIMHDKDTVAELARYLDFLGGMIREARQKFL
jgi:hypothetical protein